jgi:hypothetical protein
MQLVPLHRRRRLSDREVYAPSILRRSCKLSYGGIGSAVRCRRRTFAPGYRWTTSTFPAFSLDQGVLQEWLETLTLYRQGLEAPGNEVCDGISSWADRTLHKELKTFFQSLIYRSLAPVSLSPSITIYERKGRWAARKDSFQQRLGVAKSHIRFVGGKFSISALDSAKEIAGLY